MESTEPDVTFGAKPRAAAGHVLSSVNGVNIHEVTIPITTTEKGTVTVISSDVITTDIKVKAEWKDLNDKYHDKGDVALDFGQATSKRDFDLDPKVNSFAKDEKKMIMAGGSTLTSSSAAVT